MPQHPRWWKAVVKKLRAQKQCSRSRGLPKTDHQRSNTPPTKLRTAADVAIQPLLRQHVVCELWEAVVKRSTS